MEEQQQLMEDEIDLREIFQILRRRAKVIIGTTLACVVVAALVSFFVLTPVYEATTTLFAGRATVTPENVSTPQTLQSEMAIAKELVKDYQELATSRAVLQQVINDMNLQMTPEELSELVSVQLKNGTRIIMISVKNTDPNMAALMANKLAEVLINAVQQILNVENVQVIDAATVPDEPVSPRKTLNTAVAAVVGLMAAIVLAFIFEYFDNSIRTPEDVERHLGLPVLTIIPDLGSEGGK